MLLLQRVLLFPKDLLLELEYWAQSGEFDLEELEQVIFFQKTRIVCKIVSCQEIINCGTHYI